MALNHLAYCKVVHEIDTTYLCVAAYGCLDGMWLPTSGHCCLSSCCDSGGVRRCMSEQRAHGMNEWIDG
jgi:hypothetical protein